MYQPEVIKTCLRGLVSFSQPDDPAYPLISDALTTSSSGLNVLSSHKLCTMENIINCAPEFLNFVYPDWVANTVYKKNIRVEDAGIIYRAKANVTSATHPAADAAHWVVADPLNDWLSDLYDTAAVNLVTSMVRMKKYNWVSKSLLESQSLYRGPGALVDKIVKKSRFVGFKITVRNSDGLILIFNKIGLQFDMEQTELNIYLYNSGNQEPRVFPIAINNAGSFAWTDMSDMIIGYMIDNNTDVNSFWFLGYYEDDVTGQAIKRDINMTDFCQTCDRSEYTGFLSWSKYIGIIPIEVAAADLMPDNSLFDLKKIKYAYDTNFGMNLFITAQCDITSIICRNKNILADVLAMQLALDILNLIGFNQRTNVIGDTAKKMALADLDENPETGSFKSSYIKALVGMSFDFSGMNKACLPCDDTNTLKYSAI